MPNYVRNTALGGIMKTLFLVAGILMLVYALHWIGQGTGIVPWPAGTVMDNNIAFAYYGMGLAVIALGAIWYARRKS